MIGLEKSQLATLHTIVLNNGYFFDYFKKAWLIKAKCTIDRKALADLAVEDPKTFSDIANVAKSALVA